MLNLPTVVPTGAYPCLAVRFVLKRDIGFYMIQLYVPSVLIGEYSLSSYS